MDRIADEIEQAVAALTTLERSVPALAAPPAAFAADDVGRPGRIGRLLHARWAATLSARAREAAGAAGQLSEIAQAVRDTSADYRTSDEAARRRLRREI